MGRRLKISSKNSLRGTNDKTGRRVDSVCCKDIHQRALSVAIEITLTSTRCIQVQDRNQVLKHESIVKLGTESGSINAEFDNFINKRTVGSAVFTETGNINLMLQTPDDDLSFMTLSISELPAKGRQRGSDWVCLLFMGPEASSESISLDSLLTEMSFPSDYAPLSPDFMFIIVCILRREVERVGTGLKDLKEKVMKEKDQPLLKDPASLDEIRKRWLFGKGLAENLMKSFREILRLQGKDGGKVTYSKTLSQRVKTQITLSNMLQQDLDAIPSSLRQQHKMIESKLSIMIAEDTRRDSSSMKTIAVLTLFFLPATATASVFGMSMFDWKAKTGDTVVSRRFWIYIVVAIPLTLVVLFAWLVWFWWGLKKYEKKRGNDLEHADHTD
ncbi:hypothetical protein EG329_007689 [Mollisiaceae sp. DMI_Dod_QoI]|nr:hypothetical protein EG329_007689 [Helotiales sp. DMI_Dod_QoI]